MYFLTVFFIFCRIDSNRHFFQVFLPIILCYSCFQENLCRILHMCFECYFSGVFLVVPVLKFYVLKKKLETEVKTFSNLGNKSATDRLALRIMFAYSMSVIAVLLLLYIKVDFCLTIVRFDDGSKLW